MEPINTKRLTLRDFKESDGQDLYEYLSDHDVVKYEPYHPYSKEAAYEEARRRAKDKNFIAVCLNNSKLIGNLYLAKGEFNTWEVGYVFNKAYWGMGYATESLMEIMRYAFNSLNARRMIAMCDPKNTNSWRLLERVGMRREGTLLQNVYFFLDENNNPIWKDTYEYAILKEEFYKKEASLKEVHTQIEN